MDWFLIESEEDHSYSIVHRSFVINAGEVKVTDTVTFFYRNKPFVGTVKMFGERDVCDEELAKLGHEAKRTSKDPAADEVLSSQLGKRKSGRTTRFGVAAEPVTKPNPPNPNPKRSKKSPEEQQKEKLLAKNKQSAQNYANKKVMNWLENQKGKQDDDSDYVPNDDDKASSSGSDSDTLKEFAAKNLQRKMDRQKLVKGIKSLSPSTSPSKESLKVKLQQAELKLQMLLDSENEKERQKDETKPESKKTSKEKNGNGMNLNNDDAKDDQVEGVDENNDGLNNSAKHSDSNDAFNDSSKHSDNIDAFNDSSRHSENNDEVTESSKLSKTTDNLHESEKDLDSFDSVLEHDEKKAQMYGNREGFVMLNNNVYCSKRVLKEALTKSTNVCHIARRLLVGVFKPEALEKCTLTGQEWRAGPSGRKSPDALYQPGVNAIIEYAKTAGTQRKWKVPKADTIIKHSMSCRLGEIKRLIKDHGADELKNKYL